MSSAFADLQNRITRLEAVIDGYEAERTATAEPDRRDTLLALITEKSRALNQLLAQQGASGSSSSPSKSLLRTLAMILFE